MSHARDPAESSESSARVQDTRLNANVTATQTEHIFSQHGRPGGPREIWLRQSLLGHGAFGTVWLEKCEQPYRQDIPSLRAVKQIHLQPGSKNQVNYTRRVGRLCQVLSAQGMPLFLPHKSLVQRAKRN